MIRRRMSGAVVIAFPSLSSLFFRMHSKTVDIHCISRRLGKDPMAAGIRSFCSRVFMSQRDGTRSATRQHLEWLPYAHSTVTEGISSLFPVTEAKCVSFIGRAPHKS